MMPQTGKTRLSPSPSNVLYIEQHSYAQTHEMIMSD
jgi:hypothetical protein